LKTYFLADQGVGFISYVLISNLHQWFAKSPTWLMLMLVLTLFLVMMLLLLLLMLLTLLLVLLLMLMLEFSHGSVVLVHSA